MLKRKGNWHMIIFTCCVSISYIRPWMFQFRFYSWPYLCYKHKKYQNNEILQKIIMNHIKGKPSFESKYGTPKLMTKAQSVQNISSNTILF
jgi:hypothetical protein